MRHAVDIETLAERIYKVMELSIPVDVQKMVSILGGEIKYNQEIEAEAQIEKRGRGFVITLRSKQELNGRDRFSIAHELGHLFLHMGYLNKGKQWEAAETYYDSVFFRSFAYTTEELEANRFAAALLMPKSEFLETISQNQSGNSPRALNIDAIVDKFNVTNQAAIIRAKQLQLTR